MRRSARGERPDGGLKIGRRPGEGEVAVDQDVDDHRLEQTLADRRPDLGQSHQGVQRDLGPNRLERHTGRQVAGHRGEDVAAVEAVRDGVEHQLAVLERSGLDDPAERLAALDQQPVVRPDQDVAAAGSQAQRQSIRADTRVDHGHVHPDRHVGQREGERPGSRHGSSTGAPGARCR